MTNTSDVTARVSDVLTLSLHRLSSLHPGPCQGCLPGWPAYHARPQCQVFKSCLMGCVADDNNPCLGRSLHLEAPLISLQNVSTVGPLAIVFLPSPHVMSIFHVRQTRGAPTRSDQKIHRATRQENG